MEAAHPVYDAFTELLRYPGEGYHRRIEGCRQALARGAYATPLAEVDRLLGEFAATVAPLSVGDLEELYTSTFDLDPVCSLELGWHLFGENYSRGEFLVAMRQTLRRLGLEETTELPDHLTHVLRALGRMEPAEADRFSVNFVLPALEKMQAGLAGKSCPFENVLAALRDVILSPCGALLPEVSHG
jgi:nitrate reductase delta subunit